MLKKYKPLKWLPSLYFFQALPFFLVTSVASVLYKHYGINNETLAFYTSIFYFPWVLKAFAGPFVERHGQFRTWIFGTQILLAILLGVLSFFTSHGNFVEVTLLFFTAMAMVSVFHDVAAEGLYLHGLVGREHSFYVGWRASFFRAGWIAMQGGVISIVGMLLEEHWNMNKAWQFAFVGIAASFLMFGMLHFMTVPRCGKANRDHPKDYKTVITSFFKSDEVKVVLFYLLCFRLGEAQLQKMAMPFLLDPRNVGGLALDTKNVGLFYGTLGTLSLSIGGILGGWLISRDGLKKWVVPVTWGINLPHILYVWLAYAQPESVWAVIAAIVTEQFFYGVAFSAYLVFMVHHCRRGKYPTANYAMATGFMSLGMMLPGAWSGWLQTRVGYPMFFAWVIVCSVPSIWSAVSVKKIISKDE